MLTMRKSAPFRRKKIVEAALHLSSGVSVARVPTREIASAPGIPAAVLFKSFPTRQNLWLDVLEEIEQRDCLGWGDAKRGCSPAVRRLRKKLLSLPTLIEDLSGIQVEESNRSMNFRTLNIEPQLMGAAQICVLCWCLTDCDFDLPAEGDQIVGLQLRLTGLEPAGVEL